MSRAAVLIALLAAGALCSCGDNGGTAPTGGIMIPPFKPVSQVGRRMLGNIGGRTRAIVFAPNNPDIMYAALWFCGATPALRFLASII